MIWCFVGLKGPISTDLLIRFVKPWCQELPTHSQSFCTSRGRKDRKLGV